MNAQDPNVAKVELIAQALGELRDQVVFVGGRAVGLLLIRLIGAPALVATKFEAFADRGRNDLLGSHDAEDIINLVDGRPELTAEVASAQPELRTYLTERCRELLDRPDFADALTGMVVPDETLAERVQTVLQRLTLMARMPASANS